MTQHEPIGTLTTVGAPCWVDLAAARPDRAAAFYSGLLGWDVDEAVDGFSLCRLDGRVVAGLATDVHAELPWWSTNIAVRDADETAEAVVRCGGQLTGGPADFRDFGRWVAATDPLGTKILVFAHWAPHAGVERDDAPGAWTGTELMSGRSPALARFYEGVFGWRLDALPAAPAGSGRWISGGQAVATMSAPAERWPASRPSLWVTFFAVPDVTAALDRALTLGATRPVVRADGSALVLDNQGALVGLRTPGG